MKIVLMFSIAALCGTEFSLDSEGTPGTSQENGQKVVSQADARRFGQYSSPHITSSVGHMRTPPPVGHLRGPNFLTACYLLSLVAGAAAQRGSMFESTRGED